MTRWSLFLQTLSLLHHFLGLYFRLPETADTEKVESGYENGVLTVTIPKQEAKKARRIDVKVAA